ncbi:MAG: MBL fold metallo-hydrolase [Chitinophagales bacterium]|nr:MBL fold metallo-hydrolase [Chitinophagales bacterium]MCZ2394021.1 MBL fold metallo-hydrolase [Chitinophagales bacterium]
MIGVKSLQIEGLYGYRFSVYRFNKNVQTVYVYFLGDTLIDTGQSHSRDIVIKSLENHNVKKIILTHHHEDHSGNASFLSNLFKIPVYGHAQTVGFLKNGMKLSPLAKYLTGNVDSVNVLKIDNNQLIDTGLTQLQAIHTPGHSVDHFAYYSKEKGWLFSGDLYVADKIKYFADFESMKQQIESLQLLTNLDFDTLLCSHNPKLKNGKLHLQKKLQDFQDFYGTVVDLYNKGYNIEAILKKTGRRENSVYSILTMGSFCATNMVKSVLKDEGLILKK